MYDNFAKIAKSAAIESGLFIKRSVGRVKRVSYKGIDNIVTDVDKGSERKIISKITGAFPGHSILAEESGSRKKLSPYKWIIDPLDGTTNFAHGFPFFCVSIALEVSGIVVVGVIYDPCRDELFCARRGAGATLNGSAIRVSNTKHLSKSFLATGFSYGVKRKDRNVSNFRKLLTRSLAIRRAGSAALDLAYVACGRFDGFWEMDLHPWDSAAGMLIVKEAGGKVTRFDNSSFNPYHKDILSSNGLLHRQMSNILS